MDILNQLSPVFVSPSSHHTDFVRSRIHYKMRDYAQYKFTSPQSRAINIFFDLAQEFDDIEQVYLLCVLILRMLFQYDAELFLKNDQDQLLLVTPGIASEIPSTPKLRAETWTDSGYCYIPVRGKQSSAVNQDSNALPGEDLLGVLVLFADKAFEKHELLFLEKFANRVGFSLHNKILAQRNARHVLFLRKLAHDIGHNIITPNMRLKHMLNQLEGQLKSLGDLCQSPPDETLMHDIRVLHNRMSGHTKSIIGNFTNGALFLESLLRQSHFDFGHYVLRRSRLDICNLVMLPQFERYRAQMDELNLLLTPDQPECPGAPLMVEADLGLISQVLANLLSNAIKYAKEIDEKHPVQVRCLAERVPSAFEDGSAGAKVSVFSSGTHIPPAEAARLFDDNYRASNSTEQYGTGHGLFFVRQIVAEHAGKAGYEPVEGGNIFYFMLSVVE